jgi:hypothetical protein
MKETENVNLNFKIILSNITKKPEHRIDVHIQANILNVVHLPQLFFIHPKRVQFFSFFDMVDI